MSQADMSDNGPVLRSVRFLKETGPYRTPSNRTKRTQTGLQTVPKPDSGASRRNRIRAMLPDTWRMGLELELPDLPAPEDEDEDEVGDDGAEMATQIDTELGATRA